MLCKKSKSPLSVQREGMRGDETHSAAIVTGNKPSEFDLIAWIRGQAHELSPSLLKSIGDDCAVLGPRLPGSVALSTDMLSENVHFRRRWINPYFLGRKSLAVALSDLAATGARPHGCLLALALPAELRDDYFRCFIRGFLKEAGRWNTCLCGGDLSQSEVIHITVTVWGYVETGQPLYRSSAREDDALIVVGRLGFSRLGLQMLSQEDPECLWEVNTEKALAGWAGDPFRHLCLRAHFLPQPQIEAGIWLRERGLANAMIDVSDGLMADLHHLARESHLTAEVEMNRVPVPQLQGDQETALNAALEGGEDYALLFTASEAQVEKLRSSYPSTFPSYAVIGRMRKGEPAVYLIRGSKREKYEPRGFDHFQ